MLHPKIQDAFNRQLGAELFSAYLYAAMSAYFEATNFKGMAGWMRAQAGEEVGHAMKFYDFINERDGRVILTQVGAPKTEWDSPLDVFQDAYKHECKVSTMINELESLALGEKDHAAATFLQWFVNEQVEEEASVQAIVDKLKLVGDNGVGLFMIDNELGQRGPSAAAGSAT